MAQSVRVVINSAGVKDLLQSVEVQRDLRARAERIAAAAGDGMTAELGVGKNRARAQVYTETIDAMRAEADDRALTRAIDAGR